MSQVANLRQPKERSLEAHAVQVPNAAQFLDLEAEVDEADAAEEDEDEDEEEDDFIEDGGPVAMDRTLSHRLLFLEQTRMEEATEWNALLTRARSRGRQHAPETSPHVSNAAPAVEIAKLWRVSVKPGCEETATLVLSEKILCSSNETRDLVYVAGYGALGADVYVVPRTRLHAPSLLAKRKRPGTKPLAPQLSGARHPEAALLDVAHIVDMLGVEAIRKNPSREYEFHGKNYVDGYLHLITEEFQPKEAVPSSSEIARFKQLRLIPKSCFGQALERMGAHLICAGDYVKIVKGEARGSIGVAHRIVGEMALVWVNGEDLQLELHVDTLRKRVGIGDEVIITLGEHEEFTGWVLSNKDEMLSVYDHHTSTQVAQLKLKRDSNRHFLGCHIRVIGFHSLKGYEGIIKSTMGYNDALVELKATLQQEQFHLWNLAHLHNPTMKPLIPDPSKRAAEDNTKKSTETGSDNFCKSYFDLMRNAPAIPQSAMPLMASTPLPPSSSVSLSPTWNPSSRTPNPLSAFHPGWKGRDYEGKRVIWVGMEGRDTVVKLGLQKLLVPPKYITPLHPTTKGEKIIVYEGVMIGVEGKVISLDGTKCLVSLAKSQASITVPSNLALVIAP
ncbi:hypothetical protein DXG01_011109 [Tephrocybe rancida]|nr:hypothetical protein DXG01_011109 [Tephrocybe rancida]